VAGLMLFCSSEREITSDSIRRGSGRNVASAARPRDACLESGQFKSGSDKSEKEKRIN
jgi:hypothetical protein